MITLQKVNSTQEKWQTLTSWAWKKMTFFFSSSSLSLFLCFFFSVASSVFMSIVFSLYLVSIWSFCFLVWTLVFKHAHDTMIGLTNKFNYSSVSLLSQKSFWLFSIVSLACSRTSTGFYLKCFFAFLWVNPYGNEKKKNNNNKTQ